MTRKAFFVPDVQMCCRCGARREAIETLTPGEPGSGVVPGPLIDPCTCGCCVSCGRTLDHEDCCPTLGCPLYGAVHPLPGRWADASP